MGMFTVVAVAAALASTTLKLITPINSLSFSDVGVLVVRLFSAQPYSLQASAPQSLYVSLMLTRPENLSVALAADLLISRKVPVFSLSTKVKQARYAAERYRPDHH